MIRTSLTMTATVKSYMATTASVPWQSRSYFSGSSSSSSLTIPGTWHSFGRLVPVIATASACAVVNSAFLGHLRLTMTARHLTQPSLLHLYLLRCHAPLIVKKRCCSPVLWLLDLYPGPLPGIFSKEGGGGGHLLKALPIGGKHLFSFLLLVKQPVLSKFDRGIQAPAPPPPNSAMGLPVS